MNTQVDATEHTLEVLNGKGHLTLKWNPSDEEEVAEAKAMVESLKKQGYVFYTTERVEGDEVGKGAGTLLVERITDPTVLEDQEPPPMKVAKVDHDPNNDPPALPEGPKKCEATTAAGKPCTRNAREGSRFCGIRSHKDLGTKKESEAPKKKGRRTVAVRPMAGG
jgi:hypothetical protein